MDIATISNMVGQKLSSTQSLTNQLTADANTFLADMQTASEMQFLPGITVDTKADFTPLEQQGEVPPAPPATDSDGAALPPVPPSLVLHDYAADDPLDTGAGDFEDPSLPSDDFSLSYGEDGGRAADDIAQDFIDAVRDQIRNTEFDAGYLPDIRLGLASRLDYTTEIINRTATRLASMGIVSPQAEMQTLRDYEAEDNRRVMDNKNREASVENDRNMVDTALRLAQVLYAHADAVYARALDVAKSLLEYGNMVYQVKIAIERAGTGVSRTVMQADFESVNAQESVNKLNLQARKSNIGIFSDVSVLAIRSLENLNGKYEAQVSKYGVSIDKSRAIGSFDLSKGNLSEQALTERVNLAVQNASTALTSFITTVHAKREAARIGEGVYSEALRGAIDARNTLVSIGKRDNTTKAG